MSRRNLMFGRKKRKHLSVSRAKKDRTYRVTWRAEVTGTSFVGAKSKKIARRKVEDTEDVDPVKDIDGIDNIETDTADDTGRTD